MKRIREAIARFMQGRYGMDQFNQFLTNAMLVCMILSILFKNTVFNLLVWFLIFYVYFRAFSKNHSARYAENQKFIRVKYDIKRKWDGLFKQIKDKEHRYFKCPNCGQKVRVPKGKGNISIHCPKCNSDFIKRT